MTDSIFGFVGGDYSMLIADATAARSILAYKHDEDKIRLLDTHKILAAAGPSADCVQFTEYIQKNIALYEFRSGLKLSTKAAASYVRSELAYALRSNPYQVNLLIGGWDKEVGSSLHFMDYIASATELKFGAQGYAGNFILSTMDRHWKAGMSLEEGKELARKCIKELRTRFLINQPVFIVKVVDANGVRVETL